MEYVVVWGILTLRNCDLEVCGKAKLFGFTSRLKFDIFDQ